MNEHINIAELRTEQAKQLHKTDTPQGKQKKTAYSYTRQLKDTDTVDK